MESTGVRQRHASKNKTIRWGENTTRKGCHFTGVHFQENRQSKDGNDADVNAAVRSEIAAILDARLAKSKATCQNRSVSFRLLDDEARKLSDSVDATTARDQFARKHNQRMRGREHIFCALGVICLVCPILIVFDKLMSFFPFDYIDVLQYAAQENTIYGTIARFSLKIVLIASGISAIDKARGRACLGGCLGALSVLLLLVRYTTQRQSVLTAEQLDQVKSIKVIIDEELQKKKERLLC